MKSTMVPISKLLPENIRFRLIAAASTLNRLEREENVVNAIRYSRMRHPELFHPEAPGVLEGLTRCITANKGAKHENKIK